MPFKNHSKISSEHSKIWVSGIPIQYCASILRGTDARNWALALMTAESSFRFWSRMRTCAQGMQDQSKNMRIDFQAQAPANDRESGMIGVCSSVKQLREAPRTSNRRKAYESHTLSPSLQNGCPFGALFTQSNGRMVCARSTRKEFRTLAPILGWSSTNCIQPAF